MPGKVILNVFLIGFALSQAYNVPPSVYSPEILQCHICVGGIRTPCMSDAKSVLTLPCNNTDAFKYSSLLMSLKSREKLTVAYSIPEVYCMMLSYRNAQRRLRFVRSCIHTRSNDICAEFEKSTLYTEEEYISCLQCDGDFCNSSPITLSIGNFSLISCALIVIFRKYLINLTVTCQ